MTSGDAISSAPKRDLPGLLRRIEAATEVAKLARSAMKSGAHWSDPDRPEVVLAWAMNEIAEAQMELDATHA